MDTASHRISQIKSQSVELLRLNYIANWNYFKKKTGTIYCHHTEEFIKPTKTEASESMFQFLTRK
jgi:hypothetical protein